MPSNDTQRVEKLTGDCEDWHNVGTTNDFGVTFTNSWANLQTEKKLGNIILYYSPWSIFSEPYI